MKNIKVQGGYKKGGYEFNVLETPSSQKYHVETIEKFVLGKDTYWHGYIKGSEINEKKFPIDANPRKPGPTKVVKLMQATAQKDPSNFHHLNNGITIIASNVEFDVDENQITIDYGTTTGIHGDGICNGGHSYYAIEQYQGNLDPNLLVRIEILVIDKSLSEIDRSNKIKIISEARNAHNQLESITTAHYSGYYDNIIAALEKETIYFKWYEGDPEAVKGAEKVDTLIAKISALSPHWYSHYLNPSGNTGNHMPSARNTGSTHKKWENFKLNSEEEKNLNYMNPMILDIIKLRDEISYSLHHDDFPKVSKVWRNTRIWKYLAIKDPIELNHKIVKGKNAKGYALSHVFAAMILGSFRENVWFSLGDDGINLVGWLIEPHKLWNKHKERFMRDLNNIASSISAPSFGNAFLQNAAIYNYQFTDHEFGANVKSSISTPEIVYDTSSMQKYARDLNNKSKLYLNTEILDEDLPPFSDISNVKTSESVCYSEIV